MSQDRLSSSLLVSACLTAAAVQAKPAVVLRKGDPDSGMIYVKALARSGAAVLYAQTRDADGAPVWHRAMGANPAPEADVDTRIAREANIDPDIWAIEILDDACAHPLDPTII